MGAPLKKRARRWDRKNRLPAPKGVKVTKGEPGKRSHTSPGKPITLSGKNKRKTYYHELGHHFDYQVMDDRARGRVRKILRDKRPWRAEGGNSPHEKFAEAYGIAVLGLKGKRRTKGGYDYILPKKRHRKIVRTIRKAAKRNL